MHIVRSNFFETMEMPLLLGRGLSPRDDKSAPKAIVINQTLARRLFKDDNSIGKLLDFENPAIGGNFEVVRIVSDARYTKLQQENPPTVYASYLQQASLSQMNFEVRTVSDPLAMIAAIRDAVRQVDKNLPLFDVKDVKTQSQQIEESVARERAFARLTTFFGLLALLLAGIGLYSLMSFAVAQRTQEMGIRLALGAQMKDVSGLILKQGLRLVVIGVVIGLARAFVVSRTLSQILYGITATDPVIYVLIAAVLITTALFACWIPARQATKVAPMVALRHE